MGKDDPKIGDKMDDGSIYAGPSPETGEALYVLEPEAVVGRSLNQVNKDLAARGWRLPTSKEYVAVAKALNIATGRDKPDPTAAYWSGTAGPDQQEFAIPVKGFRPVKHGPG